MMANDKCRNLKKKIFKWGKQIFWSWKWLVNYGHTDEPMYERLKHLLTQRSWGITVLGFVNVADLWTYILD
jgi:hypothetical protein